MSSMESFMIKLNGIDYMPVTLPSKTVDILVFRLAVEEVERLHVSQYSIELIDVLKIIERRITNER